MQIGAPCLTRVYRPERSIGPMVLPIANAAEAAVVEGFEVRGARTLLEVCGFLTGECPLVPHRVDLQALMRERAADAVDFAEVKAQHAAKRALEIAAAGGHNIFMSPGLVALRCGHQLIALRPPLFF